MAELLFSNSYSLMIVAMMGVLFVVSGVGSVFAYDRQRRNMPLVSEWGDLGEKITRRRSETIELEAKLDEMNQKIGERDRIAAEIGGMQEMLEALRLEKSGLDDARLQIDDVKRQAAAAALQLVTLETELKDASTRLADEKEAIAAAAVLLKDKEREIGDLDAKLAERRAELGRLPIELKAEIEARTQELAQIKADVDANREERGRLLAARSELAELAGIKAMQQSEIATLSADRAAKDAEFKQIDSEVESLRSGFAALRQSAQALEERMPSLASKVALYEAEIAQLEVLARQRREEAAQLEASRRAEAHESDKLRSQIERLGDSFASLKQQHQQVEEGLLELMVRRVGLEENIETLRKTEGGASAEAAFDERVIDDLKTVPDVLKAPRTDYPPTSEEEALHNVTVYLRRLRLEYSDRVIRAFHTSLKINDFAQLTVLAGVSGTGKSLLPRRYAEAMGIHFLPFAVEPRWDSPQDLLGFYNYVEKRFRATDLARALVHLDPTNTSGLAKSDSNFKDQMMIVLLDEMNLARVEYYFSEFLSRLEARPTWHSGMSEDARRDAMITVDIRGRADGPIRLYPSHNMLFVGTMNDDESTQSLSDKVLDRGNIMQFAAPSEFGDTKAEANVPPPGHNLSFLTWRNWVRSPARMSEVEKSQTARAIGKLARIMNDCGRPFGHRLNAAITAYVANYPTFNGKESDVNIPLADQIELRIMPKLRGLSIEDNSKIFEDLQSIIRDDLNDEQFSQKLKENVERQGAAGGLFNWRGYSRTGP